MPGNNRNICPMFLFDKSVLVYMEKCKMTTFQGWSVPENNYTRIPHALWNAEDLDCYEFRILSYILRHTWGFQEFDVLKKITIDEIQYGRKYNVKERMDKGTQISRGKISQSLNSLEAKGYLRVFTNDEDKARIKKYYAPKMKIAEAEKNDPDADVIKVSDIVIQSSHDEPRVHDMNAEFTTRTRSEKETIERKEKDSPSKSEGGNIEIPLEYQNEKPGIKVNVEEESSKEKEAVPETRLVNFIRNYKGNRKVKISPAQAKLLSSPVWATIEGTSTSMPSPEELFETTNGLFERFLRGRLDFLWSKIEPPKVLKATNIINSIRSYDSNRGWLWYKEKYGRYASTEAPEISIDDLGPTISLEDLE